MRAPSDLIVSLIETATFIGAPQIFDGIPTRQLFQAAQVSGT
jgi:hypothetical protein